MSLKRLLAVVLLAVFAAFILRVFVFGIYVVPSSSMVPTLIKGDTIYASKYIYGYSGVGSFGGLIRTVGRLGGSPPARGDVVVFKAPGDDDRILIKRLIGLPGDKIRLRRGQLYINGKPVPRDKLTAPLAFPGDDESSGDYADYIERLPDSSEHPIRMIRGMEYDEKLNNMSEITVSAHYYFFMGDNRDRSEDSRLQNIGPIPEENLIGRAEKTLFSMSSDVPIWKVSQWSWAIRWHRLFTKI